MTRIPAGRRSTCLELKIPRRLESPNTWNGRHWRVKYRLSQTWEQEVIAARMWTNRGVRSDVPFEECVNGLKRRPESIGLVRVEVERHVPSMRNYIRDDDNLRFAVKPLLDALKRQGYIKDDSRKWLDHPTPTQHVSADGKSWTIVRISAAEH